VVKNLALSKRAMKNLSKLPQHIRDKLDFWIIGVENFGLEIMRKTPGFHDEPLFGKRKGQRSIRLSNHYRAIYELRSSSAKHIVLVTEVSKHEY
jgi:toxin HigB-1